MSFEIAAAGTLFAVWLGGLLSAVPVMVWVERRVSALIQDRRGPNRLGPFGLLQPLADALKFLFKEEMRPERADRILYLAAPIVALVPALTTCVVIPLGPPVEVSGRTVPLLVADVDTGALLFLALASFGVYSLVLAGYGSGNKYSLLGSIRASAQLISYELALGLAVLAVLVPVGSLRLDLVVEAQLGFRWGWVPGWNLLTQPVGFLVFLVAAFAETQRLPFDLPEAESELVGGFHTEYGSMKFALFFMGEYMAMTVLSALAATLYLGGWSLPGVEFSGWGGAVAGLAVLTVKIAALLLFFVWVRWTLPRFRFDQLLELGWKVLLPLALLNLGWAGTATVAGWL